MNRRDRRKDAATMKHGCGDCGVEEGEFRIFGCDMERCPFCGGQLIYCGCVYEKLGIDCSEDGLTDEQSEEWDRLLKEKGLIPFIYEPLSCDDCGVDTGDIGGKHEWYIVKEKVWRRAGMKDGFLCIGCLEKRIGRTLRQLDFTDAPVNWLFDPWSTPRLLSRLKGAADA